MNFYDSTQYENSGRSREGAQAPHICGLKKQRGGQCNGNAASESFLVDAYVSSPGKESTFQWGQIQTPQMPLHFYLFSFATCISWFIQCILVC